MSLLLLLACGPSADDTGGPPAWSYPLDDTLTFADLQALGTHNSYHLRTEGVEVEEWDYDHAPLDVQLGEQGVRQFELDVNWNPDTRVWEVYHVGVLDQNTTCWLLTDCLATMKGWSDDHPAHHPLFTLLEVKAPYDEADADAMLAQLEDEVRGVWPEERLITPDDVIGQATGLSEAVATVGWPTLGALRGQALFVLHDGGDWRSRYTEGHTTTAGRALFPDGGGDLDLPVAAVDTINDPRGGADAIAAAVAAGRLVRTRTDSDGDEARANDPTTRDAALASGAHFVSTDFPVPHEETGYVVTIPGGTPSRCNPLRAPPECSSEAIESPEAVGP